MAATAITTAKITKWNGSVVMPTLVAVDGTDRKAEVTMGADQKTIILIKNANSSAAKTVTVKAGTGVQGCNDDVISIAASTTICYVPESGRFCAGKKVTLVGESTDIQVGAVQLP